MHEDGRDRHEGDDPHQPPPVRPEAFPEQERGIEHQKKVYREGMEAHEVHERKLSRPVWEDHGHRSRRQRDRIEVFR